MNHVSPSHPDPRPLDSTQAFRSLAATIFVGVFCWITISLGFLGLKLLMQQRPQFVGPPVRTSKAVLVQDSPRVVVRKATDDVSVVQSAQPESSEILFQMQGRRDYRGLKTISDMSGEVRARYLLTNVFDEPLFVLLRSPHPRAENGEGSLLFASGLRLVASQSGVQESAKDAWYWSGSLEAHGSATVEISYQVASLKGIAYQQLDQDGMPVRHLVIQVRRADLESVQFETGDGLLPNPGETVVWERRDFLGPDTFAANIVESRNLYASLSQLLEIGPVISLLFLLSISSVILARQPLTPVQILTISVGYAFYFPLILYLSSRFSFAVSLAIAALVPGALLLNYGRWLVGARVGLIGGLVFLGLYQVFPTLAAFAGWNRGMVLLSLGVATLWVLINLQNQSLRRRPIAPFLVVALPLAICPRATEAEAQAVQVILPAELASRILPSQTEPVRPWISFDPCTYEARQDETHLSIEARVGLTVFRPSESPSVLLALPVHLQEHQADSTPSDLLHLVSTSNRLGLLATQPGKGTLKLSYRVPIEHREGKRRAEIPLFIETSGTMRFSASRDDMEFLGGSVWAKAREDNRVMYSVGVAGAAALIVEWRDPGGDSGAPSAGAPEGTAAMYGIGLTRAEHLTVINSDSSCTHFAEYELPAFHKEEFRLRLPSEARLISVSVNGVEIESPPMEDRWCRIRLAARDSRPLTQRVSLRLSYPPVRLGFLGAVALSMPEVAQTAGVLEWVAALPSGFDIEVVSSGLEAQKTTADLARFGDYGRVLKSHPQVYLSKNLAPPGAVSLNLRYRQTIAGMHGTRRE